MRFPSYRPIALTLITDDTGPKSSDNLVTIFPNNISRHLHAVHPTQRAHYLNTRAIPVSELCAPPSAISALKSFPPRRFFNPQNKNDDASYTRD
jgi:hypothetical protein